MLRTWSGPLTIEGVQTGDGRVLTDGSVSFSKLPLPLMYVPDGSMHTDVNFSAPQVGVIQTIDRQDGGRIMGTGIIDTDMHPAAVELVRRMDTGVAPHGTDQYVSIDPDNWAVQIFATGDLDEDMLLIASARHVPFGTTWVSMPHPRYLLRSMVAAAGDPDPGKDGGTLLFEDNVDDFLARFTSLRIRGATLVNIPAFDDAAIRLDKIAVTAGAPAQPDPAFQITWPSAVTAATTTLTKVMAAHAAPSLSRGLLVPDLPALEVFDEPGEPDGSLNIDEYRVSGYIALRDSCHNGYADRCVPPPQEPDYVPYHHGSVMCEDGTAVKTGAFTWGIPHADLDDDMLAAFAHYANPVHGFADVCVGMNKWGIWHAGSLRPASKFTDPLTTADVRVLCALSMSGDWRWDIATARLRLIAALAVNHPGFLVPRRDAVTASARRASYVLAPDPEVRMSPDGTHPWSLVAAGLVPPSEYAATEPCGCHDEQSVANQLGRIEDTVNALASRTEHLVPVEARAQLARIRG